jgi:hypothetical protein
MKKLQATLVVSVEFPVADNEVEEEALALQDFLTEVGKELQDTAPEEAKCNFNISVSKVENEEAGQPNVPANPGSDKSLN